MADDPVSSPHTSSPRLSKASLIRLGLIGPAQSKEADRIFLFAQRHGCLSISTNSMVGERRVGCLSGPLITASPPPAFFPSLMVCYTSKWESRPRRREGAAVCSFTLLLVNTIDLVCFYS